MRCFSYLFLLIISAFSNIPINAAPCKTEDGECFKGIITDVLKNFVDGIPAMGIEPLDPLYYDVIEASVVDMKLHFTNVTTKGLKDCTVGRVSVTKEVLDWEMHCPKLVMSSKYEINGHLMVLPVHGSGDALFRSGKIVFVFHVDYATVEKPDGKKYIQVTKYKIKGDPKEPINFKLSNLFDGQKLLSDTFHDFANTNWKAISDLFLDSVILPNFEVIISRINKYFKEKLTKEDIFLD